MTNRIDAGKSGQRRWVRTTAGVGALLLIAALAASSNAEQPRPKVTAGSYKGVVFQDYSPEEADAGLCTPYTSTPVSFKIERNRITDFRATVIATCENKLPPRLITVELDGQYRLHGPPEARWFTTLGSIRAPLKGNAAYGAVKPKVANGYVSALSKALDDATGDSYCYVPEGARWRASRQ